MADLPPISRRSDVLPFQVMDVMSRAHALEQQGRDIVHMEVGEPGRQTPTRALEAGKRAMDEGLTGYTLALGIGRLRKRISAHYDELYGVRVDPERVIVTMGSSAAFSLAFMACFDVGERVAIARPGYPAYGRIMQGLGLRAHEVPTLPQDKFQPTPEQVMALDGVAGMLVASPSNPGGSLIEPARLQGLCASAAERGLWLISDEIYHRVTFDEPAQTALAYSDDVIVINSFSKYYCMTGWRIGWMVVPERLIRPVERLAQNFFISAPTISQYVAAAVFDCTDELDAQVTQYRRNRDIVVRALQAAGVPYIAPPEGAFYLYADMSPFTNDSQAFCKDMLSGAGVSAVTGVDFDAREGSRYVRFSIAGPEDRMVEAAKRLAEWLPGQRG